MGKIQGASRAGLALTDLHVRRMYGETYDGLHLRELSPALNVIYGPNAAGKSTLARAIERTLWPEQDDRRSIVEATFRFDNANWRADLETGRVRFERDGRPAERPAVAPADQAGRYHLSLHDLLSASEGSSAVFARAIMKEAAGGVDLSAAEQSLGFKAVRPSTGKLTRTASEAWEKVIEAVERQRSLQADARRLTRLREELEAARSARDHMEFLERLREYLDARELCTAKRSALEVFEPVLRIMTGQEVEVLKRLRSDLADAESDAADAEARISSLTERLESSIVHGFDPSDTLVSDLRIRVDVLEKHEGELRNVTHELAADRQERDDAWMRLTSGFDPDQARLVDMEGVGHLSDFVQNSEQLRAREKALEERERQYTAEKLDEPLVTPDEVCCRDALRILGRWLQADSPDSDHVSRGPAVGLVVLILAAGAIGIFTPWPIAAAAAIVVLAVVAAVLLRRLTKRKNRSEHRDRLVEDFRKLGLQPPETWSVDGVSELLEQLQRELDQYQDRAFAAKWAAQIRAELETVRQQRAEMADERARIAERLGIQPDVTEEALYWLVESLRQWQELDRKVRSREAERASHLDEVEVLKEKIQAKLAPFGFGPCEDYVQARAFLTELCEARAKYENDWDAREQAETTLNKAREAASRCTQEIDAFFERLDLNRDDDAGLHRLCLRLDAYRTAEKAVIDASARESVALERLQASAEYDEAVLERSLSEVRDEFERARTSAARVDALAEEVTSIEERIRAAGQAHDLEEARAKHAEALEELRLRREEDFRMVVGHCLAEYVRRRTRDDQLPQVFHRAREIFSEITRDRYRLDINREGDQFSAYDNVLQRGRSLDQLSSGTRVQLLLSVRLAFLEQQEQGVMAPLVLDEALANSDDRKAEEIIHSILSVCRTGRQVFYFTAQQDEVQRWQLVLAEHDMNARFIPLGSAPAPSDVDNAALPAPVWNTSFPEPDELSHVEYGTEIEAPRWDFRMPVESLHVWYLIEDVKTLHSVLSAGFERWGALQQMISRGGAHAVGLAKADTDALELCARALATWQSGWKVGRGIPVDRSALVASGAVTATFLDRVSELCEAMKGDGKALIRALRQGEVTRFQSTKADELEEYLRDHGYIDSSSILPNEELWAMTMAEVATEAHSNGISLLRIQTFLERVASPDLLDTPDVAGRAANAS